LGRVLRLVQRHVCARQRGVTLPFPRVDSRSRISWALSLLLLRSSWVGLGKKTARRVPARRGPGVHLCAGIASLCRLGGPHQRRRPRSGKKFLSQTPASNATRRGRLQPAERRTQHLQRLFFGSVSSPGPNAPNPEEQYDAIRAHLKPGNWPGCPGPTPLWSRPPPSRAWARLAVSPSF